LEGACGLQRDLAMYDFGIATDYDLPRERDPPEYSAKSSSTTKPAATDELTSPSTRTTDKTYEEEITVSV